jgi:glycosyltransferase involved in cell wall biosynthesis
MHVLIITAAFNAEPFIARAINSVIAQTHADWRMVVVDDGSNDGTADAALRFPDTRIQVIRQANAGVSAARNRGLDAADADFVLFLDADDWLAPDAISRLLTALSRAPGAVAAAGPVRFFNEARGRARRRHLSPPAGDLLPRILRRNLFANGGHVLIRAEALRAAGRFRPDLSFGEDWEFWVRLAAQGRFAADPADAPVLYVSERDNGAYFRQAADPAAVQRCLDAIFTNPSLQARFGPDGLRAHRRLAEAETAWAAGQVSLALNNPRAARRMLAKSVLIRPSARRCALLLLAAAASLGGRPGRA